MSYLSLPDQTIPEEDKDQAWHELHCREFATFSLSDHYNDQKEVMLRLFRGYNAELSDKEQELAKRITCPHGIDTGIDYIVYPLIQAKCEQLMGEYTMRPLPRHPYVIDKKSKNAKYDQKLEMFAEQMMREMMEDLQEDMGFTPQTANPEMEIPEDIEEWAETTFKTVAEVVCKNFIDIFLDANRNRKKFHTAFLKFLITDRAHLVLDHHRGHTTVRDVHPMDATYDQDPYRFVQNDHEYFFEEYFLSENEIYNRFNLNDKQKEAVKTTFEAIQNIDNSHGDSTRLEIAQRYDGWYSANNKQARLRLIRGMWKSHKSVPVKKSKNKKTGEDIFKKLPQDYKIPEKEKEDVERINGDIPRCCTMLGPDICLEWGEMPDRHSWVDSPWNSILPVVSVIRDNTTGSAIIKSIAAKLEQLQQMASEILFEIRLALKQAGASRVLLYDAAQTPKEFTKDGSSGLNRVLHHIKRDRLMIINSAEKHFKQNFNQFTSLDLSQKGALNDLFAGLETIERLADYFTGIMPEREGNIGQYQTATGADRAIRGSTARTEVIFSPFDEFVAAVLEMVVRQSKFDYEKGQVLQYILGEGKVKFLKLMEEFFFADFGIYLGNPRRDKDIADRIEAAAEMALSNANTPEMILGLIDVFEGDGAAEKKKAFERMVNRMEQRRQEDMAAAQQAQQADVEQKGADRDQELLISREGNETEKDVARIYADSKNMDTRIKRDSEERQTASKLATDLIKERNQRQDA